MSNRSIIEDWIHNNLSPKQCNSASVKYDRMALQSGGRLVFIYEEPDPGDAYHWRDTAYCRAFVEAVGSGSGKTILDIGPGDGWPSLNIAPYFGKVVGIDPSLTRVDVQRGNAARMGIKNCEFLQMDVCEMAFEDESFDGVVAASAIEQSDDPEQGLREIFRVLKPGSCLAMTFENYDERESSDELRIDTDDDCRLIYTNCDRDHARESEYTISLNPDLVSGDDILASLGENPIAALESLRPAMLGCEYCELRHFTSEYLDKLLAEIGFVDIRGIDRTFGGLMPFLDTVLSMGKSNYFRDTFIGIAEIFGVSAVRNAKLGVSDFVIARKPLIL